MSCKRSEYQNVLLKQVWYSLSDYLKRDFYLSVGRLEVILAEDKKRYYKLSFPFFGSWN